jgi:hypothetical protein
MPLGVCSPSESQIQPEDRGMTRILKLFGTILALLATLFLSSPAAAQEQKYLYRATLLQAAPGRLLELIEYCKTKVGLDAKDGNQTALWMRHSQGDHWDLLLLFPMESYEAYYNPKRIEQRYVADVLVRALSTNTVMVAWQEDIFVYGPPFEELKAAFAKGSFYHVEMMQALPGQLRTLQHERGWENTYAKELKRPENFIFVRDQGAAWDIFTIGVYRDLKHYAESVDIPVKLQEEAAKKAGFDSASAIGPFLRTLIRSHHDTLAVAVK